MYSFTCIGNVPLLFTTHLTLGNPWKGVKFRIFSYSIYTQTLRGTGRENTLVKSRVSNLCKMKEGGNERHNL